MCHCPQCCTDAIFELNDYHLRMPIGHPSREQGLAEDCRALRVLHLLLRERRKKDAARVPLPPFPCAGPGCTRQVTNARRSSRRYCSDVCRVRACRARMRASKRHPEPDHPLPHRWESEQQFGEYWQGELAAAGQS
jgi:hypothetical protein